MLSKEDVLMKRRILSIITALALCLSLCPAWAFAAEADPALCKHHPAHTEDCDYTAPAEGQPCGHEHTDECYALGTFPDTDSGDYYEIGADAENLLDCQHVHDSECGYVQADPGQPCGFVCRICPVEALIAALPGKVTEDNADEVRARLEEILDLYRELSEDEQEQIDLSRCYELQEALDGANDPDPVEGAVDYREASWNGSEVIYENKTADSCTPVTDSAEAVTWSESWYAVSGTVTIDQPITVSGDVSLILTDGCKLTASKGIVVSVNNSLTIYAQSGGSGTLTATGTAGAAGIGGGYDGFRGHIAIHGGIVTAKGGGPDPSQSIMGGGAGIGDGYGKADDDGKITIYGGTVTASAVYGGAGIGGTTGHESGGIINIHGGTVNASGSSVGAGIGGGYSGGGGRITITGGTVTANGYSAGIGGGEATSNGQGGAGGIISITGGIVTANGGSDATAIGKGTNGSDTNSDGSSPSVSIGGNAVVFANHLLEPNTAGWSGVVFDGQTGTVYGNATPNCSFEIPSAATLTILENSSLTISEDITLTNNGTLFQSGTLNGSGTLSGNGTFITKNLMENMISVPDNLYYNGKDRTEDLKTQLSDELNKGIVICGQTFTISGWTVAVSRTDDLHYTATYTNESDTTKNFTKTITLQQSGTTLDGTVKTYNGETETKDFTASDTITVKATPTPTGAAPANSAMFTASLAAPAAGQMAVFVGDTQVSAPADVGEDGAYTMTVSAADVLAAAGGPGTGITLTAKFVGNNNMADAAGTVPVNISAVAKVVNGSSTTFVGALADAFIEGNDGAIITLLSEVDLGANYISIDNTFTLDLNGQTVKATGSGAFNISGGSLTIQDSGTGGKIESSNITVSVIGGTLSIESGTVSGFYGVGIYGGTVNISGGVISGEEMGLWVHNSGKAVLSGGTLIGRFAVSISADASVTLKDMLATGYAYHQNDIPVAKAEGLVGDYEAGEVPLDAKPAWLTGTVTVQKCEHNGKDVCTYTHTSGATTHQKTCLACGNKWDEENCSFGENGKCACEAVLAVALKDNAELTYTGEAQTPEVNVTVDGIALAAEKYQLSYDNNINAGNTAKVTVTAVGGSFSGSVSTTFTIGKAALTIKANDQTITYGESITEGTDQVTAAALCTGDTLKGITLNASTKNVPGGTITPSAAQIQNSSGADVTANYSITYETGTLTINKSRPTIAFASGYDPSKTYDGQTIPNPTAGNLAITGANYADVTFEWSAEPKKAGTYTLTASIKETPNTEEASTDPLTVTISKAPLTVTGATVASKTYNGNADASVRRDL